MKKLVLVFVCLLGITLVSGCCGAAKKREYAYARACSANMRVMMGCIEMYNMDHAEMMKTPDFSMFQEGGLMMQKGLLKQPIQLPGDKCSYSFSGDFSSADETGAGVISCSIHGTVEDIDKNYPRQ